jgi:hypothetical protein
MRASGVGGERGVGSPGPLFAANLEGPTEHKKHYQTLLNPAFRAPRS